MHSVILGVDPGTNITGFGVIKVVSNRFSVIEYGQIRLSSKELLSKRYGLIFRRITDLIDRYSPQAVVTETQYINRNVNSAIKLGMARGAVILAAELAFSKPIECFEYAPTRAKKAVVGQGGASKEQVKRMIALQLSLSMDQLSEDAADALALALCHANCIRSNHHKSYRV